MSERQVAPEAAELMTRESLMPEGWDKPKQPEPAEPEVTEPDEEEVAEDELAEAQGVEEQEEEAERLPEAVIERMKLNKFLDDAGVTMDEFYRQVYVERDGKEVSVSQAWDDYKELQSANEALLRERSELQEKVNQASTQVPTQRVNPEAQALANQAELKLQAINSTDWSKWDPGQAANAKLDLQYQAQALWNDAQKKQVEYEQDLNTKMRQALDEADRQTRSRIPQWNDQAVRNSEWNAVADMVSAYGISRQELDATIDPRWRHVLRDAMAANAEKRRIAQGVKRVRKVGTVLKAGSRSTAEAKKPTLKDAKQALAEARKSGASFEEINKLRLQLPLG